MPIPIAPGIKAASFCAAEAKDTATSPTLAVAPKKPSYIYPMIIVTRFIPKGFSGIALFPFIFLRFTADRQNEKMINHEKIHLRQQWEMLLVFFYLWYVSEFFIRWISCGNRYAAYRNISFEKEAYGFESDGGYLKRRKFWSFTKFL